MKNLEKEIEKKSVVQEFKGHKTITIEDKDLYQIISTTIDDVTGDNYTEYKVEVTDKGKKKIKLRYSVDDAYYNPVRNYEKELARARKKELGL